MVFEGCATIILCCFVSCRCSGLQILYTLLQNVAQEEAAAQSFYQTYFCDILQHIFSVVTDTSHTAGELTHNWCRSVVWICSRPNDIYTFKNCWRLLCRSDEHVYVKIIGSDHSKAVVVQYNLLKALVWKMEVTSCLKDHTLLSTDLFGSWL